MEGSKKVFRWPTSEVRTHLFLTLLSLGFNVPSAMWSSRLSGTRLESADADAALVFSGWLVSAREHTQHHLLQRDSHSFLNTRGSHVQETRDAHCAKDLLESTRDCSQFSFCLREMFFHCINVGSHHLYKSLQWDGTKFTIAITFQSGVASCHPFILEVNGR